MRFLWLLLATTAAAQPLTLKEAVLRAVQNAPEVRISLAQQEKAHQAYREARAQFIPNLVVGSGLAGTRGIPLSMEGAAPSLFQVVSTAMLFNRPQRLAIAEARTSWQAAEAGGTARVDEVAWKTASAYVELNKVQRSLEFARRDVGSATRVEQVTAALVSEGREIPLEAAKARLALARSRQVVGQLEGQVATLQAALQALIGLPEGETIETVESPVELPSARFASLGGVLERVLRSHPELKRLELEVQARESRVRSEQAQRWPQLDLIGQYAVLTKMNNYEDFFSRFERHNFQLGMSARFTIFDGKRIDARVGQAEADLMQARAALAAARNDLALATRRAYEEVRQREAGQQVAKLELDVARESVGVSLARFQEGRISTAELEKARSEESGRWLAFLEATFALERARLDLLRQTGDLVAALR